MTEPITIWIPGPLRSERKRWQSTIRRFVDTLERADAKAKIAVFAQQAFAAAGAGPFEGPVRISITAYRRRPQSKRATKKRQAARWPITRPDADNYVKLTQDALTGIAWRDDAQVCDQRCVKLYAEDESLVIRIAALEEPREATNARIADGSANAVRPTGAGAGERR